MKVFQTLSFFSNPHHMKIIAAILSFTFLISCKYSTVEIADCSADEIYQIQIDTLWVQPEVFSGLGLLQYSNDTLYLFDSKFSILNKYLVDGTFIGRFLGKGSGPSELRFTPHLFSLTSDSLMAFVGDFLVGTYLNSEEVAIQPLNWDIKHSLEFMMKSPKPDMTGIYGIDWYPGFNRISNDFDHNRVIIPINSEHPLFNGFMHSKYYKEARSFASFNIHTGELIEMFGRRPASYLDKKFPANFDFCFFNWYEDTLLVSWAIDPAIFKYNTKRELVGQISRAGSIEDTQYPIYQHYEEAIEKTVEERKTYGHYQSVYGDFENGIVMRTYFKGKEMGYGLQVFKNNCFAGDFDIPSQLEIVGKSKTHYYAAGIQDIENGRYGVIRLKLIKEENNLN